MAKYIILTEELNILSKTKTVYMNSDLVLKLEKSQTGSKITLNVLNKNDEFETISVKETPEEIIMKIEAINTMREEPKSWV